MAARRPSPYRDSFELESLESQPDFRDDPDSPLPNIDNLPNAQKPRWGRDAAASRTDEILSFLVKLLRPRLTWRYVLFFILGLYLFYCLAESSPLLASKLPQYTGPHGVGMLDLEIPLEKPRTISDTRFKKSGETAYELETVLFSLYYPARKDARERNRKHTWVAKPVSVTAKGYAKVAHVDNFLMRGIFTFGLWAIGGSIKIPALVDVPLLHYNDESEDHEKEEQDAAFPIVVFSHGTASSRTDYTQLCGELASRGVVCAAIEHRDGSGPGTVIQLPSGIKKERYFYNAKELDTDPPADTDTLKKNQLDFRQAEIEETVAILERINAGHGAAISDANMFPEGKYLPAFESRLNTSHLVIAGHSYGATGALQAVKSAPSKQQPALGVIAFDPGKSSGRLNTDILIPTLVVHSNSWSSKHSIFYGRPHFDTVKELVEGVLEKTGAAWFMTMLGTSHPSITDAPLIEPLLLSWTTGASINVLDGLREYVGVIMEFVQFLGNGTRGRLLGEGITHPTYGQDERSEEQKKEQDKSLEKFWQIHVSPPAAEGKE